jgi:hypothetical protein
LIEIKVGTGKFTCSYFGCHDKGDLNGLSGGRDCAGWGIEGPGVGPFKNCLKEAILAVFADYQWITLVVGKSIVPYVIELTCHLRSGSADATGSAQFGTISEACVPLFAIMFVPYLEHTFDYVLGFSHRAHLHAGSILSERTTRPLRQIASQYATDNAAVKRNTAA